MGTPQLKHIAEQSLQAPSDSYLTNTGDTLALALVLFLFLCLALEFHRPFLRPGLATLKHSYLTNICTFLFNDITLSLLSIPTLYFIAQQFAGLGLLSSMPDGPFKYLLTFVLLDLALYAWHYATHQIDVLWIFHKVHHSDKTLNVTTGLRFHLGELFLEVLVRVVFIGMIGVSANVVLVSQTIITLFVLFHHTNITFPGEQGLARIFIVPRLHRLHHSALRAEHDSNYGAVFSVWDRLFGSLKEQDPKAIGLEGVDEQRFTDLIRYGLTTRIHFRRLPAFGHAIRETIKRGSYL